MDARRYRFIFGNILLVFILAACTLTSAGTPSGSRGSPSTQPVGASLGGGCANAYYPVPAGATWSYSSTGSTSVGAYTYTRTVSAVSSSGFTTSDLYSTGVAWDVNWTCQAGNLAALDTGAGAAIMTTSKVKMTTKSAIAEGYNIPASFDAGKTWSEKVTLNETTQSNGKSEDSQIVAQIDCTAGSAGSVTVPAGTFTTVTATCSKTVTVSAIVQGKSTQLATNHEDILYSYAKGVGFVKSVATGGSDNETVVLTQYKLP